ncbi:beta-ribofuranosylaminobenzene 5'-phosphate synthase [Candidatus Methanophagaceae archaeon]|nr:beta-ribofuranosylaminobenzene 5'-phosphate synthase [Methanophagales archaeon]
MDEHEPAVKQHMDISKNKIWSLSRRYGLQPLHRVLLGHDGSMTALLELISCSEVALRTIKQSIVPCPQEAADLLAVAAGEPTNERDILIIRLSDGSPLIYARSYTPLIRLEPAFKADLIRANNPIGNIMQKYRIEARREIIDVGYLDKDQNLEELLACPPPYLWRVYNIITQGKPLITIKEFFSTSFQTL